MSVKLEIYNAIKTIASLPANKFRTFGIWNGQYDEMDKLKVGGGEKAILWPACLLEFSQMSYENKKLATPNSNIKNPQDISFLITLHLGFENLNDEDIAFYQIDPRIDLLVNAIHGLQGTYFNQIQRVSEDQDSNHNNLIHWKVTFRCRGFDPGSYDILTDANLPIGTVTDIAITGSIVNQEPFTI